MNETNSASSPQPPAGPASLRWLDRLPWVLLIPIAIFMGMVPLSGEEPHHLLQKLRMLSEGTLTRPLDIFDLFMHGTPQALVFLKGYYELAKARAR